MTNLLAVATSAAVAVDDCTAFAIAGECASVTPIAYWYDNACHSEPEPVDPPVSTGITISTGGNTSFNTGGGGSLGVVQ